MEKIYDVVVIGGGPAGLACAIKCKENNLQVLLIEREEKLGGILKQCIHDGFGLTRYQERLTGVEYASRDISRLKELQVDTLTSTFVLDVKKESDLFNLTISNESGISFIQSRTLVLATGCRERTAKQILIHGTRPSGVFTAGCVQNLVNIHGLMPCHNVVILGSGDIGLIMARRLTLEGCNVIGVYEAKSTPTGLKRNISQCLNDFNIPLYLSKTVTRIIGADRVEAVEISDVDNALNPIANTSQIVKCDSLIVSVGLIPENELAEKLNIPLSINTKGPIVDQNLMTSIPGVFAIGNCLSVNDLVDYVSENGFIAANGVRQYLQAKKEINLVEVIKGNDILTIVPERLDLSSSLSKVTFYIRAKSDALNKKIIIKDDSKEYHSQMIPVIHAANSIRVNVDLSTLKGKLKVELQ